MKIQLNGKTEEADQGINLLDLLKSKEIDPNKVVVEHNGEIAKREDWGSITLKENDTLEVLRFVGGG